MKKLGRSFERLESLDLFTRFQGDTLATYNAATKNSFLEQIGNELDRDFKAESTLHGVRVNILFQLMVANLGDVTLIKSEDSGDCFYLGDPIIVPDYRVVTQNGETLLVEVKNHFARNPMRPFRVKRTYLEKLQRYAATLGTPLRFAIYWPGWNFWSLNDPTHFKAAGNYLELPLEQAFAQNEMAKLGDYSIGTVPPLQLRLKASPNRPRTISEKGQVNITIGGYELLTGGQLIEDKAEKSIAMYLMMFGKWQSEAVVEFDNQHLPSAILHTAQPEEIRKEQGFDVVGELSAMFSSYYNFYTLQNGNVHLWLMDEPSQVSPVIPAGYKGKRLKLWRFHLQPNFEI